MIQKVARLRVQGPINLNSESSLIKAINKLESKRIKALIVVINSFGGSLRSTKNIAESLRTYRDYNKVPIYCFAQDFCLNSANIILTLGTKCYANKLSMIGDFGYVFEGLDGQDFRNRYRVGKQYISNTQVKVKNAPFSTFRINDERIVNSWLTESQKQLKQEIIRNRNINIDFHNQSVDSFDKNYLSDSIVEPFQAVKSGLIDGIYNIEDIMEEKFKHNKIWQANQRKFSSPFMNFLYDLQDYLRSERKGE